MHEYIYTALHMAIKNNDSVIYDLSYVMEFDTSHLFYINMSIKNASINLYGFMYGI